MTHIVNNNSSNNSINNNNTSNTYILLTPGHSLPKNICRLLGASLLPSTLLLITHDKKLIEGWRNQSMLMILGQSDGGSDKGHAYNYAVPLRNRCAITQRYPVEILFIYFVFLRHITLYRL